MVTIKNRVYTVRRHSLSFGLLGIGTVSDNEGRTLLTVILPLGMDEVGGFLVMAPTEVKGRVSEVPRFSDFLIIFKYDQ